MSGTSQGPGWWLASDGKWYPPESHQDGSYRREWITGDDGDAPPPSPPTEPSGRRRVAGIVIAIVVAVIIAAVAVVVISRGSTASADAVTLEPVGTVGDDPFTTAVSVHEVTSFPNDVKRVVGTQAPPSTATNGGGVVFTGTAPGLYGGTQNQHACDPAQLKTFLNENPDKAAAWASVQGIQPSGIGAFVDSLTPVVLTRDTLVTNHGFRDGRATPLQSVLQAGTAVMVDSTGLPRVKCACGNPLLAPSSASTDLSRTRGQAWPGFSITVVVTVQAGPPATSLQLVDVDTGTLITEPVGTGQPPASTGGSGQLKDGIYGFLGTMECKAGSGPLPAGSFLLVKGDEATVSFASQPVPVPATISSQGSSFVIDSTYTYGPDGKPTRAPAGTPSGTALTLHLTGTTSDGGNSISGTGSDTGFLCEYTFTGRHNSTALVPGSSTTSSTLVKPPGGGGLASSLDVARALFSTVDSSAHEGICGGDYSTCPLTPELKAAFGRFDRPTGGQITQSSDPICRCQNTPPSVNYLGASLPGDLRGQSDVAVTGVRLNFATPYDIFVVARKQADGTWLAADTYCAATKGDPDPYANRMTGPNPGPCM